MFLIIYFRKKQRTNESNNERVKQRNKQQESLAIRSWHWLLIPILKSIYTLISHSKNISKT